jgi:hypothetical protein
MPTPLLPRSSIWRREREARNNLSRCASCEFRTGSWLMCWWIVLKAAPASASCRRSRMTRRQRSLRKSQARSRQETRFCWRRVWTAGLSARFNSGWTRRPTSRIAPISRNCWCIDRRVATALMARLEQEARRRGRWLLVLDTVPGENGHRLYLRAGWTQTGLVPDYALFPDGRLCDTASCGSGWSGDRQASRPSFRGDAKHRSRISRLPDVRLHI